MRLNYAIVFVSDMKRSVAFYRDTLGLPLRFESPHWTEFATAGASLALHQSSASATKEAAKETPSCHCRPGPPVPNRDDLPERMLE